MYVLVHVHVHVGSVPGAPMSRRRKSHCMVVGWPASGQRSHAVAAMHRWPSNMLEHEPTSSSASGGAPSGQSSVGCTHALHMHKPCTCHAHAIPGRSKRGRNMHTHAHMHTHIHAPCMHACTHLGGANRGRRAASPAASPPAHRTAARRARARRGAPPLCVRERPHRSPLHCRRRSASAPEDSHEHVVHMQWSAHEACRVRCVRHALVASRQRACSAHHSTPSRTHALAPICAAAAA